MELGKWQFENQAIVAVFDVLAFKSMMSDWSTIEDTCTKVTSLISLINTIAQKPSKFSIDSIPSAASIEVVQASDTFVIYCAYKSSSDIAQFLWNIQQLLFHSIRECFPLRGAITIGSVAANLSEHLFLGPAVVEAIDYEKIVDWAGAIICPKLEQEIVRRKLDDHVGSLIVKYSVPYKDKFLERCPDVEKQIFCINWLSDSPNFISPKYISTKFPKCPVETKEGIMAINKINNTKLFMEYVLTLESAPWPTNRNVAFESIGNGKRAIRFVLNE